MLGNMQAAAPERQANSAPLLSVQVLRAVAALLVLFSHAEPSLAEFGYTNLIPDFTYGAIGVGLFFVISGFIMVYTSERLFAQPGASWQFFSRRLLRIVPLYWVLTTIVIVGWHGLKLPSFLTWTNVVGSYLFIPIERPTGGTAPVLVVGWTLDYEMLFYALFALAIAFRRSIAVLTVTAILFGIVTVHQLIARDVGPPWSVWASPIVYDFVFGMGIALAYRKGMRIPLTASYAIVFFAVAITVCAHLLGLVNEEPMAIAYSRPLYWGIGSALVVAAVVLARTDRPLPAALKPMVAIGDASYALYLFHSFIPFGMMVLKFPRLINPATQPYLYSAVFILISVASSLALHRLDEWSRMIIRGRMRLWPSIVNAVESS